MHLVNPLTAFTWSAPLDILGVAMAGIPEKQGWSFSRAGWMAAREDPAIDPDKFGAMLRRQLRPLSRSTLEKARGEYVHRNAPAFPRYFIVEPVNVCNRACPFCSINVMQRYGPDGKEARGIMKLAHFNALMLECGLYDVYGISLYQLGEPFLWSEKVNTERLTIKALVDTAKEIGGFRAVNLSTNGDVGNLDCVLGSKLDDLIISIDGTTPEVYAANRPSTRPNDAGAFERTLQRVHSFLARKAARGEPKPFVRLQIINKADTAPQILDFIRYWIEVPGVDDVFIKHLDSMRPWLGNQVVSDDEDAVKAARVAAMPCQHLYAVGSMVVTGQFNACCHDAKTALSDGVTIENSTFADWWNGRFMRELRAEHERGEFRLPCRDCRERDVWLG